MYRPPARYRPKPMTSASAGKTTSRMNRRRARRKAFKENFRSSGFGPASRASGANCNTVSAITPLRDLRLLNRAPQVLLHGGQIGAHRLDGCFIKAGQRGRQQLLGMDAKALEYGPRRRCQIKPLHPAILRIGTPLDEAVLGKAVEQTGERNRLHLEDIGEFALFEAFRTVEPDQHDPLRARHAELRGPLVGVSPQQARDIIEGKSEFSIWRDRQRHGTSLYVEYNKLAYKIFKGKFVRCSAAACAWLKRECGDGDQARPSPANASLWWPAASSEKQQNTTRAKPRGLAATSDATAPTAMRAARSAGKP